MAHSGHFGDIGEKERIPQGLVEGRSVVRKVILDSLFPTEDVRVGMFSTVRDSTLIGKYVF